jgi:hypothetical protein
MVEKYVTQPHARARLQSSVFGPYLPLLVQSLEQAEYAAETIRLHLRAVIRFGRWLQRRKVTLSDVNEATVECYVQHEQQKTPSSSGPRPYKAIGLPHLLRVLRQHGVIAVPLNTGPRSSVEEWLRKFADYLEHVTGCASTTRINYIRTARRLFQELFADGEVEWETLTAVVLSWLPRSRPCHQRTGAGKGHTCGTTGEAVQGRRYLAPLPRYALMP